MTLKEFYDYAIQEGANENAEISVTGRYGYDGFSRQIDESKITTYDDSVVISLEDLKSY